MTESLVLQALSHVDDPDLKRDIVSLGMVKNLSISGMRVSFDVELTTPACPMKDMIRNACINAVKHLVNAEAEVHVNMTAQVTGSSRTDQLSGIKNLIAVGSGKGGVGKSTIAAQLALALRKSGANVGLLDADIYGPSIPTLFGIKGQQPGMQEIDGVNRMRPITKYGISLMSIGLLIPPGQAVVWRGPMLSSALRQLLNDVAWGNLDYLVVDLPPGTGDVHITLCQNFPLTGVVIVTTPQQLALDDAEKAAAMYRMQGIDVPILGVVENMSWFETPDMPGKKYPLFGEGGGQLLADQFQVPLLGKIPLTIAMQEACSHGEADRILDDSVVGEKLQAFAGEVAREVSKINALKLN